LLPTGITLENSLGRSVFVMVKNRFLLVFALGAVSGCLGGLGTVLLTNSWLVTGAIYVTFSFVPALVGSRWSSAALIEIWGLLALGTAIGVFGSVVLHPMYRGGERNLWPFEIAVFIGAGLLPSWGGLLVGRYFGSPRA
jgi:hypothetical protein